MWVGFSLKASGRGGAGESVRQRLRGWRNRRLSIDQGSADFEDTRINYVLIAAAGATPAAPSGLTADATAPGTVSLLWADNSSTETTFTLQRSTRADFSTGLQSFTLAAGQTTYQDTGLNSATTYYYRVRADGAGGSSFAQSAAVTTPILDTDGDGIPDGQETPPFIVGVDDRATDSDHDGASNAAEWAAGTNPAGGLSFLQFSQLFAVPGSPAGTDVTLLFPTVVGRSYLVDFTDSLPGGIWTALPGSIRTGDGSAQAVTDSPLSPARFYRLQVWR